MSDDKSFSVSKKLDGIENTVSGEKVENGWILTIRKEWRDKPKEGSEYGDWHEESKKYISVENPMDKLKESSATDIKEAETLLKSVFNNGIFVT